MNLHIMREKTVSMKRELGILAKGLSLFLAFSSTLEALKKGLTSQQVLCPPLDQVIGTINNKSSSKYGFNNSTEPAAKVFE